MFGKTKRVVVIALAAILLNILPAYPTAPNEKGLWNAPQKMKECNNCYNYATNYPNSSFAQPGWASGIMNDNPYTCGGLLAGAEADGLSFAGHSLAEARSRCDEGCCLVALVLSDSDYHWYREDEDGTWSHKPGGTDAISVDGSGNPVTDPANANHNYSNLTGLNYHTFCGFMCVCLDRLVTLQGKKTAQPLPPNWFDDCPSPCVENAPFCLDKGAPSLDPGCCCSCVIRILGVGVGECK